MIIYWTLLCRKGQIANDLLYMGIFALLIGMWTLGDVNGVAILFDCRPYASYFSYVLLMLMGSTFLLFIKHFLDAEDRYIHKVLAIYNFGAAFVSIMLQCLNIADFKQTVLLTHIALVLDLLYLLFVIWDKIRKGKFMQIAVGFAEYDPEKDADLDQTRCRADALMYENKKQLKALVRESNM